MSRSQKSSVDWLALGEACQLLGVAPQTLRRWSDSGRVSVFTTPGGHRRYRRQSLERLVAERAPARPSLARSGMTRSRIVRAYRSRPATASPSWVVELDVAQRDAFRSHGRLLAGALLAHLDTTDSIQADHQLSEATAHAATYGRMVSELGVSLSQAVEGFLQFRRPFLNELSAVAVRRGFDAAATTDLMDAAERAMDRLLIAAMTAFSVRQVGGLKRGSRPAIPERTAPARP